MSYSTHLDAKRKTFRSAQPLQEGRFVKITVARVGTSSPTVDYCAASDANAIGTVESQTFEAGDPVTVNLLTGQGTVIASASGAIPAGDPAFGAANGQVAASGTVRRGIAIDAAAAAGDLIELLPVNG